MLRFEIGTTFRRGSRWASGFVLLSVATLFGPSASATLIIDGPTTNWTPVLYEATPDPFLDQQTGDLEGDLVGDENHPSFYLQFDDAGTESLTDGTIAFRIRVAEQENPDGFSGALFIGIDADLDGSLDLFIGVDNSGSGDTIAIWNAGSDLNVSPSTTSIESPPVVTYAESDVNYDFSPVTLALDPLALTTNVDGGTTQGNNDPTDYFLSFSLPMADIVAQLDFLGLEFDQSTGITLVMATATQDNSLNQDLNGVQGGVKSPELWSELGAQSEILSFDGSAQVPEPASALLLLLGGAMLLRSARRPTRRPLP